MATIFGDVHNIPILWDSYQPLMGVLDENWGTLSHQIDGGGPVDRQIPMVFPTTTDQFRFIWGLGL